MTHRTCIENYLLEPDLIDHWWKYQHKEKTENPSSKWGHKDSPGIEKISEWLETSAKKLKDYQAVRWALGELSKGADGSGSDKSEFSDARADCRIIISR